MDAAWSGVTETTVDTSSATERHKATKNQMKRKDVQERICDDYAVPEDIASEALLMLQDMNQPNADNDIDDDEYALPVGTEKLPDLVQEMNQERGIDTVIDEKKDETEHNESSAETVIYDLNENAPEDAE